MTASADDVVRVGQVRIPMSTALQWIRTYTDLKRNTSSEAPYAYPAYDRFQPGESDPMHLTDADLLAPGLLNVQIKMRTFYDLQRIRSRLEEALTHERLKTPLADVAPDRVGDMVRPLYTVLDDRESRPWKAKATTLSKILHRKRPQSIVLHDKWVRSCYVGHGAHAPYAKTRTWVDYMTAITVAIGADIRAQRHAFACLDEVTSCPGELTPVRLLDILAWMSRGVSPNQS